MSKDKVRVDKWLWSVRIFKSRTIASDACRSGKVKLNEVAIKPSFLIQREQVLNVRKEGFNMTYKVVDLIDKRVSAILAEPCYENLTPADELNKYKEWYIGKGRPEQRQKGAGRPTKRERRDIDKFKDETG